MQRDLKVPNTVRLFSFPLDVEAQLPFVETFATCYIKGVQKMEIRAMEELASVLFASLSYSY